MQIARDVLAATSPSTGPSYRTNHADRPNPTSQLTDRHQKLRLSRSPVEDPSLTKPSVVRHALYLDDAIHVEFACLNPCALSTSAEEVIDSSPIAVGNSDPLALHNPPHPAAQYTGAIEILGPAPFEP
ncbi:MAG: hypothetical protein DLM57_17950 [Pseudonocardiales bacterium]|nr:MAG: hypothetical protein DLM57_17950 [Pseudonocardiales bacterium]